MSNITTNGYNASITLTDSGVLIKPNFMGSVLNKETALSEKFIPYSSISGINLTKGIPIIRDGFLQINTKGEVDTNDNKVNQDATGKNTIRFTFTMNNNFSEISNEIIRRIS